MGKVIIDDGLETKREMEKWHIRGANQNVGVLKSKAHGREKIKLVEKE